MLLGRTSFQSISDLKGLSEEETDPIYDSVYQEAISLTIERVHGASENKTLPPALEKAMHYAMHCLVESIDREMISEVESIDEEDMNPDVTVEDEAVIEAHMLVITMLMLNAKLCLNAGLASSAVEYFGWCTYSATTLLDVCDS